MVCIPFVFSDLNILKDLGMTFENFYHLIVKPYASHVKTLRLLLSLDVLSDANTAKILAAAVNANAVLLYHRDFKPLPLDTPRGRPETDWMYLTNAEIVDSLKRKRLDSLGIYCGRFRNGGPTDNLDGPITLLSQIGESHEARTSLKLLDIELYSIPVDIYDIIREEFTSLVSLSITYALESYFGDIWDPIQGVKWPPTTNLTHLHLIWCSIPRALHIPHLVRHFVSLKHLTLASSHSILFPAIRGPQGWYSAKDALWKVRKPLDTFHLEQQGDWELVLMGVIPTKTLIITNLVGGHLIRALKDDINYFPKLEAIRIEPHVPRYYGEYQFSPENLQLLEEICRKRGVSIIRDAKPVADYVCPQEERK